MTGSVTGRVRRVTDTNYCCLGGDDGGRRRSFDLRENKRFLLQMCFHNADSDRVVTCSRKKEVWS